MPLTGIGRDIRGLLHEVISARVRNHHAELSGMSIVAPRIHDEPHAARPNVADTLLERLGDDVRSAPLPT